MFHIVINWCDQILILRNWDNQLIFLLGNQAGMVVYFAGVLLVSYLGFVFFSEQLNPFRKPAVFVNRRRWRYGRRMGLATLGAGAIVIFLAEFLKLHPALALSVGLFEFSLLWWMFSSRMTSQ